MAKVSDLFEIKNGLSSSLVKNITEKANEDYNIAYLRPSNSMQNTVAGYLNKKDIDSKYIFEPESIFVSTDGAGSHSYSYVSSFVFVPNSNVCVLVPKKTLNYNEKVFYALCITRNRYKFSYGRKPKGKRLADIIIPDLDQIPSWVYKTPIPTDVPEWLLEDGYKQACKYIDMGLDSPTFENITESYNERNGVFEERKELRKEEWKEFRLGELFEISLGKHVNKNSIDIGKTPYISSTSQNNGRIDFIEIEPLFDDNCITVGSRGNDAISFYQGEPFYASNNVSVLIPKFKLNKHIAFFITTLILKEKYRYSYGRIMNSEKAKETIIKLPTTPDGSPDWLFMENYIKSLKYSGSI
jgi:hypothetical protein